MGMPSISITFTEVAATAVKRGERGIIAMILKEDSVPETNPVVCRSAADIPAALPDSAKQQIMLALAGYVNAPAKVIAYFIPATVIPEGETDPVNNTDYTSAYAFLRTIRFDYLVVPSVETDGNTAGVVSFVKAERSNNNLIKAVLPNTAADTEGVINYATQTVTEGQTTYTTEQYCARIAGIIAGTPLNISCTYAAIPELTDCERLTAEQMDAAVDGGKLIVWWDGEKVKTARGVNSLTTLTGSKNSQFQKIKIVDAMDMITNDIRRTTEDSYLGKYANSYDNKCLLIAAIGNYFETLVLDGVLSRFSVEIDIEANKRFLRAKGVNVDSMSDMEIKQADTGTYVFLTAELSMLDAIEDIVLPITI